MQILENHTILLTLEGSQDSRLYSVSHFLGCKRITYYILVGFSQLLEIYDSFPSTYIYTHTPSPFLFLTQRSPDNYGGIWFIIAEIMGIWHCILSIFPSILVFFLF